MYRRLKSQIRYKPFRRRLVRGITTTTRPVQWRVRRTRTSSRLCLYRRRLIRVERVAVAAVRNPRDPNANYIAHSLPFNRKGADSRRGKARTRPVRAKQPNLVRVVEEAKQEAKASSNEDSTTKGCTDTRQISSRTMPRKRCKEKNQLDTSRVLLQGRLIPGRVNNRGRDISRHI